MINQSINKLLFFDIETVGITKDYAELSEKYPALLKQFHNYFDWFLKRFPEDASLTKEEVYFNRAALVPEFSRIVCASFAFMTPDGKIHKQTFSDSDEKKLLKDVNVLMDKVFRMDFWLCGHNIKMFDIPFLGKKMIFKGLNIPSNLQLWDKKPWEIPILDTAEFFSFGSWSQKFLGLDLLACSLGIDSPKEDIDGSQVHGTYWEDKDHERIKEYCERDVVTVMDVLKKVSR
jgi:hypothetical protein